LSFNPNAIIFSSKAWEDYEYWIKHDKKKIDRINKLIKDTLRSPFEGIGKPEPLKLNLQGLWSRRIDEEHRLIYEYNDDNLSIISCRHHY
jgi:toxin YoeB